MRNVYLLKKNMCLEFRGFSVIELLVAAVLITMIASATLTAITDMQGDVFAKNRDQVVAGLEKRNYEGAYSVFSSSQVGAAILDSSWHDVENEVFTANMTLNPLLGQRDRSLSANECRVETVDFDGTDRKITLSNIPTCNNVLRDLALLDLDANPVPVYVNGALEVCAIRWIDPMTRAINECPSGVCDAGGSTCFMQSDGLTPTERVAVNLDSLVFLPRYSAQASVLCEISGTSYNTGTGTHTLALTRGCNDRFGAQIADLTRFSGVLIDAQVVSGVVQSVNDRVICREFENYNSAGQTIETRNAVCSYQNGTSLSASLPASTGTWYLSLPISETTSPNVASSYFIEPLELPGPELLRLVVDVDYYDDFDISPFDQADNCPLDPNCRVPVQQDSPRLINSEGKIYVDSDSVDALNALSQIEVEVIDESDDTLAGKGELSLASTPAGVTVSGNDSVSLSLTGTASNLNLALRQLRYSGPTDTFDDQRLKIILSQNEYRQETGPGANDAHPHLNIEVWPNCGCEADGVGVGETRPTAVNLEVGRWDGTSIVAPDASNPIEEFTTVTVRGAEDPTDFYGVDESIANCRKLSGSNWNTIDCRNSTKQQVLSWPDAAVAAIYERTGGSVNRFNKYSFYMNFEARWNMDPTSPTDDPTASNFLPRNGTQCGRETPFDSDSSPVDRWLQIVGGTGGVAHDAIEARYNSSQAVNPNNLTAPDNGACRAKWVFYNVRNSSEMGDPAVADQGSVAVDYPHWLLDDGANGNANGDQMDTVVTNNTETISQGWGNFSDGLLMALPVDDVNDTLANYDMDPVLQSQDPVFVLNYWDSVNRWRIRQVRTGTCPDATTDANAWRNIFIHPEFEDGLSDSALRALYQAADNTNNAHLTADDNLMASARNAIRIKVATAKLCPDTAMFADP